MQIVIDIPKHYIGMLGYSNENIDVILDAVRNGKPLPAGHGDLIDRDALFVNSEFDYTGDGYGCIKWSEILTFPPIIGGDKEGEDDRG